MPRKDSGDNNIFVFFSLARKPSLRMISNPSVARVVKWQTRAFKGRMPKGMRVRVPPRAPSPAGGWSGFTAVKPEG